MTCHGLFSRVRLFEEFSPGSYRARNRGLTEAIGSVVCFTDADCIPDRHWLANAVGVLLRQPSPSFVGGSVQLFAENDSNYSGGG